jgi:DNA adenine methylase
VLLQKPRSPLETYNDLDGNVVNFFRVLRDRPDELIERIRLTPWARGEYEDCRRSFGSEVERARRFFVSGWMSISGMAHEKSTGWRAATFSDQSYTPHLFQFEFTKSELLKIANRLLAVQIEDTEAAYMIERYGNFSDSLVYFDPPYVTDTRIATEQYRFEVDDQFHHDAADLLRACAGYVVISGYACPLYADLYERHGWQRIDTMAQTNSGGKRIESLWLSPRTVEALAMPAQVGLFQETV